MPFTLDQIREALSRHQPQFLDRTLSITEAAVALVLAGAGRDLSLCFIQRAEHPEDPWSGHMALPGGRACEEDPSPRVVAERETLEEVGLALAEEHWLGALSEVPVRLGGPDRRMVVSPYVYYLGEERPAFVIHEAEVAEAFWIPLSYLWDPRNASPMEWEWKGSTVLYPAIRFRESAIWGLTFRVLTLFSDVLATPLPHLEEIPGLAG